jgi:hypothetical protein
VEDFDSFNDSDCEVFNRKKVREYIIRAFPEAQIMRLSKDELCYKVGSKVVRVKNQSNYQFAIWFLALVAIGVASLLAMPGLEPWQNLGIFGALTVIGGVGWHYAVRISLHYKTLFLDPMEMAIATDRTKGNMQASCLQLLWAVAYAVPFLARVSSINPFTWGAPTSRIEPMVGDPLLAALNLAIDLKDSNEAESVRKRWLYQKAVGLARDRLERKFRIGWWRSTRFPVWILGLSFGLGGVLFILN